MIALVLNAGCSGHKIVARINGVPLLDSDFQARAQAVRQIPANSGLDAGAVALITMVEDELTRQLAAQKGVLPSEATVLAMIGYNTDQRRWIEPDYDTLLRSGSVDPTEEAAGIRLTLERLGIGTDGAKVDSPALDQAYQSARHSLALPAIWTIRTLDFGTVAEANAALARLKQAGGFVEGAQAIGLQATESRLIASGPNENPVLQANPALQQRLETLQPHTFTSAPVAVQVSSAQGARTVYVIAYMATKEPEKILPEPEVAPELTVTALQQRYPDWSTHYNHAMADFMRKSDIQINVLRYQKLISTYISSAIASAEAAGAPAGGPQGAGAAQAPSTPVPAPSRPAGPAGKP